MLLWRSSLRYLLQHVWQFGLSILGVALGVVVVTAIDLANASAERAFSISAEALSGSATHHIIGGSDGLPESLYRDLRVEIGARASVPVVEAHARPSNFPASQLQIIGNDPLAAAPLLSRSGTDAGMTKLTHLLTQANTALMLRTTAEQFGLTPGSRLDIDINGRAHSITLVGYLEAGDAVTEQGLTQVIVTDIATAQELAGMLGRLSRIELQIGDNAAGQALMKRIETALPPDAQIVSASQRAATLKQMTHAFALNLTALSLLALLIGMFMIYNAISFSVIQRRRLIGMLRALGVTRSEIFRLVLSEALLIAVLGTTLGLLAGVWLGKGLLFLVTRTINDLYFVLNVSSFDISLVSLVKGMVLGVGGTLLAAVWPALDATRTAPRASLIRSQDEQRFARQVPRAAWVGMAVLVLSIAMLGLPARNLAFSFAALFSIMAGFALVAPLLIVRLVQLLQRPLQTLFGLIGKMSARGIIRSLSRSGVAIAALAVAISATIGVGVMVDSFRHTVEHWLENSLRADIFIAPAEDTAGQATLNPQLVRRIAASPDVAMLSIGRRVPLQSPQGRTELFVLQVPRAGFAGFQLKAGSDESAWDGFSRGEAVLISEPYAYHHNLGLGDSLVLPTDKGRQRFTIAGVFYDYGSSQGVVLMSRTTYQKFWRDRTIGSLGVYLKPGIAPDAALQRLHKISTGEQLDVRSNRALREAAMSVFDRSFAITNVLRGLTVLIAFIGVLSALMALQLERARELAILRASGLLPRQVWGLVSLETGLMGFIAGLLALPLGLLLAYVLIVVINRRSFGWTMQISIDPGILLQAVLLAVVAALLAGLYPAYRMARTSPALALREE